MPRWVSSLRNCTAIVVAKKTFRNVCVHFGLPVAGLLQLHRNGNATKRGKNGPARVVGNPMIQQVFDLIDCELEIIRMELAERFAAPLQTASNVRWVSIGSKSKIFELAGGLFHSGELGTCDGSRLAFADVVRALGLAFNVDTRNMYIQRHQNRNRFKGAAQFLRRLVALVEKDSEDML